MLTRQRIINPADFLKWQRGLIGSQIKGADTSSSTAYAAWHTLMVRSNILMETVLKLPESATPSTLDEVVAALEKQHLKAHLHTKTWGDWIHFDDYSTVISIESMRGLSSSATIEHAEGEETEEPIPSIHRAFAKLGWHGIDDEGEFSL